MLTVIVDALVYPMVTQMEDCALGLSFAIRKSEHEHNAT